MTVSSEKGEFEMFSKSEEVIRVFFDVQTEREWNMWLNAFKKVQKFYFNKCRNYDPSFDSITPVNLKTVKQMIYAYLKGFNNRRIHHYDVKCRKFKKSIGQNNYNNEDRYFCVMARRTEEEYLTLEKVLSNK